MRDEPPADPSSTKVERAIGATVLLVAVAVSVAAWQANRSAAPAPSDEDIAQLVERIRPELAPGDAFVVRPSWEERLWQPLGELLGGKAYPSGLMRGDRIDPMELLPFERAWVIGTHGRPPTLPPELGVEAPQLQEEVGALRLARYQLPELKVLARLSESLGALEIDRGGRRCKKMGSQHRCGSQPWLNVRVERRDVAHRDVAWVYAHAGAGDELLSISWPRVPHGAALVVRAGFNQRAVRKDEGTELTLAVIVDDGPATSLTLAPHEYVQRRLVVPLAEARHHRVRFEIRARDNGYRQLMLEADVVGSIPAAIAQTESAQLR